MASSSRESTSHLMDNFTQVEFIVEYKSLMKDLDPDQLIELFANSIQTHHCSETETVRLLVVRKIQELHNSSQFNTDQLIRIRRLFLQFYPQIDVSKEIFLSKDLMALFISTLSNSNNRPVAVLNYHVNCFFKNGLKNSSSQRAIDRQLFFAVRNDYKELVDFLIETGADVNAINENRSTPLFTAVESGSIETTSILLKHGADVHFLATSDDMSPFQLSLEKRKYEITKLFLDSSNWQLPPSTSDCTSPSSSSSSSIDDGFYNQSPLLFPIRDRNIDLVKLLLDKGFSPNQGTPSPLMDAIECLTDAIEISVSMDEKSPPLSVIREEQVQMIKLLLDYGADVNKEDSRGDTPLTFAAQIGNVQVVELLLKRGANIASVNREKGTLLCTYLEMIAKGANDHSEVLELLVTSGAEIRTTDLQESSFLSDVKQLGSRGKRIWAAAKQRPDTDEAIRYAKKYVRFKLLSHAFALNSVIDIEGTRICGEGVSQEIVCAKIASLSSKFSQTFPESFAPASITEFVEGLRLAADHHTVPVSEYLERIQNGKPTIILTGYRSHAVAMMFWQGILFICNRSSWKMCTQQVCRYDSAKLNIEIIEEFLRLREQTVNDYNYALHNRWGASGTLLEKIGFTRSSNEEHLTKLIILSNQTVGNCSWASAEGIVYAYWMLDKLKGNDFKLPENPEEVALLKASTDTFFNHWLAFAQNDLLEKYKATGSDPEAVLNPE